MSANGAVSRLRDAFRTHRAYAAAAAVLTGCLILLLPPVYRSLGPAIVVWSYNLAVVLTALAGAVLSAALWRSFGRGEISRRIWGALTVGMLLWTLGEAIWAADLLLFGQSLSQPSAADVAWIVAYLPLTLGLSLRYHSYRIAPRTVWHALLLIAAVLALSLIAFTLILPELEAPAEAGWFERTVNALYPAGDLLLAYWAILIVSGLAGGALFSAWRLIAAGYLCVTVSDLIFAYAVRFGLYQVGPAMGLNAPTFISDWLYLASYLSIALGTYFHARLHRAI